MDELLRELIGVLDLEPGGADVFVGHSERDRHGGVYGGQLVAQGLVAAARTVHERVAHSLYASFLDRGDPRRPLRYAVERVRDGRSFAHRRVSASQGAGTMFQMQLGFQPLEKGFEHQLRMPPAPDPETLPGPAQLAERLRAELPAETASWAARPRAIEVRYARLPANLGGRGEGGNQMWFRAAGPVGDDPLLHQALLVYATDLSFNDNAARPHARPGLLGVRMASLDHAVWLHVPARVDDWLLFHQESPRAAGARGFVRGSIFTRSGTLVASVAQECLLRPATRGPGGVAE
jgi:acyl-CoA thioesterase-2